MIPKIIHYGCFGGWSLSALDERCIESWKRVLPDYEIRFWNDDNGPHHSRFFREALRSHPVNCSNYLKFWALNEFGGVFLDNDVEMLRPFDLEHGAFLGFQRDDVWDDCVNCAVLAAVPGHEFIRRCMERLDDAAGHVWPVWAGCTVPTEELQFRGMSGLNVEQRVGDIMVYDKERFYPYGHDEEPLEMFTDRTIAVHRWAKGWRV